MTHIRPEQYNPTPTSLCSGVYAPSSISLYHWRARVTSEAITGQIARLPERVCPYCQQLADSSAGV